MLYIFKTFCVLKLHIWIYSLIKKTYILSWQITQTQYLQDSVTQIWLSRAKWFFFFFFCLCQHKKNLGHTDAPKHTESYRISTISGSASVSKNKQQVCVGVLEKLLVLKELRFQKVKRSPGFNSQFYLCWFDLFLCNCCFLEVVIHKLIAFTKEMLECFYHFICKK